MSEEQKEQREHKIDISQMKGCKHEFIREGNYVKCKKCTLMFEDFEKRFPLKEANKKFK